jgi:RNA polymerase sigma factor (sigma-70 family)
LDLKSKEQLSWESPRIDRAAGGDDKAFGELYQAYAPLIYSRVLMPKLGRPDAAEDALSETFRSGYERIDRFEQKGVSIYFWFARIAVNKAMDMHRARERSRRALGNFETMLAPMLGKVALPDERLDAHVAAETLRTRIQSVLAQINPRYRRAIELRFFEQRSREECAEAMEVKLGTFDVLVLRALKGFRKKWEEIDE